MKISSVLALILLAALGFGGPASAQEPGPVMSVDEALAAVKDEQSGGPRFIGRTVRVTGLVRAGYSEGPNGPSVTLGSARRPGVVVCRFDPGNPNNARDHLAGKKYLTVTGAVRGVRNIRPPRSSSTNRVMMVEMSGCVAD